MLRYFKIILLLCVIFLCSGCSQQESTSPITDVNNLEGRTIGVDPVNLPFTYYGGNGDTLYGSDIEYISHFANAYGYTIEYVAGEYQSLMMSLTSGRIDILMSGLSQLYRSDVEASQLAMVSDAYMPSKIVFVEVENYDALEVTSTID